MELDDDLSLIDELLSEPGEDVQLSEMEVLVMEEDNERCLIFSKFFELFELVVEFCAERTTSNFPFAARAPISKASRTVDVLYAQVST